MNADPHAAPRPGFRSVGDNAVRLFGLTPAERMRRFAVKTGLDPASPDAPVVLANLDFACDPAWFTHLRDVPGTVLTFGDCPVLAHARNETAAAAIEAGMAGDDFTLPADHEALAAESAGSLVNDELRKREPPFVMPLTLATADAAERASYDGAYKGVTDLLTLYLWRRPAFYLTRWSAAAGLSPNLITAIGAVLCGLAFYLFWIGAYWPGIAAGFVFMVLDTVDGKLARCTGTSSKWGHALDHGIDLVHPVFWWWAWAEGLDAYGTPVSPETYWIVLGVIIGGYVLQRAIEGIFIARFHMHIHVWERIDSRFRLITARRNPNMVILVAAMLFARPDIGLIAVAWWTALSLLFHVARLVQALSRGRVESWLG